MSRLFTPAEAKKRDCPFIRYCINESGVIQDKAPPIYVHACCQADDCILWRWSNPSDTKGYCGAGGRP